MRALLSVLFAVLLSACVARAPMGCASVGYGFRVDPRFSPAEVAQIQAACDMWNEASRGRARWYIDPQGDNEIERVSDPVAVAWAEKHYGAPVLAYTQRHLGYALIFVHADVIQAKFAPHLKELVAHELGHAAGMKHTGPLDSLMHSSYEGATEITSADLAECQRVSACW